MSYAFYVRVAAAIAAISIAGTTSSALANKTTTLPGGANQTAGVSGTIAQVLFNGTLRLRGMSFKEAGATEKIPQAPQVTERAFVFRTIVSNGSHRRDFSYFNATIVDADGITIPGKLMDDGWDIEPAAAARTAIEFIVPREFMPKRIVLMEAATQNHRAFRIALRPSDVPAASAVAPTASP